MKLHLVLFVLSQIMFVSLIVIIAMLGVMLLTEGYDKNVMIIEIVCVIICYPVYKIACWKPNKESNEKV